MKKILSVLLSILMSISVVTGFNIEAYATGNTFESATNIYFNSAYSNTLNQNEKNFYKFVLPGSGKINISSTASISKVTYYIYDEYGKNIYEKCVEWDENIELSYFSESLDLIKGTYYFSVIVNGNKGNSYNFSITYESANESFINENDGSDNTVLTANNISIGYTYNGQIAKNDEKDFYKFYLSDACKLKISAVSYIEKVRFNIYDINGNLVWRANNYETYFHDAYEIYYGIEKDKNTGKGEVNDVAELAAGIYYFGVIKYGENTGNYSFAIDLLTQENCTHEFETPTVSPTYFAKGYTQYTCKICGYTYADNYTSKLKVTVPKIYNTKKGKKKVTLYFSNYYGLDGIQIKYSTSKKFTKKSTKTASTKKTSKTLKKLKGHKKYYIKIRGYKIVDGKKAYSKWSKVKSVKTK